MIEFGCFHTSFPTSNTSIQTLTTTYSLGYDSILPTTVHSNCEGGGDEKGKQNLPVTQWLQLEKNTYKP